MTPRAKAKKKKPGKIAVHYGAMAAKACAEGRPVASNPEQFTILFQNAIDLALKEQPR